VSGSNSQLVSPSVSTPSVSVVMPVVNEEKHLRASVQRVLAQDYAGPFDVTLAVGPSKDHTDEVARALAEEFPQVRVVSNPSGSTPAGLNAAINASSGEIVVRVDGHAMIPADYVTCAVEVLTRTGADNVGGVMAAEGTGEFERAVAAAMTSRFGVGDASFHVGGVEGPALTVYLGCFRRSALERVGGYDDSMERAQDWELNLRIRESGGVVYFTPRLHVTYRPRHSLSALSRQYHDYGRWRREVARRHPSTLSLRYLAAPVTVATIGVGLAVSVVGLLSSRPNLVGVGFAPAAVYAGGNAIASMVTGFRTGEGRVAMRLPAVFATMHGAWGLGFLRGGAGTK